MPESEGRNAHLFNGGKIPSYVILEDVSDFCRYLANCGEKKRKMPM